MATKRVKHFYIQALGITVMVLALVRCAFPGIAGKQAEKSPSDSRGESAETAVKNTERNTSFNENKTANYQTYKKTEYLKDSMPPHPIKSVPGYAETFPDSNHVQLLAAHRWGVTPVKNRDDAEKRKNEVVYMGTSPYYTVAHLDASIPYLVPHAAILLEDIGRNFFDSLQVKGMPLHRLVVSSVLRTQTDVSRLRRSNKNATQQSCHLYGTTFDINYNVYTPLAAGREVPGDKLKFVLSEVLRDLRAEGRCYIKYEMQQPCFHITVR